MAPRVFHPRHRRLAGDRHGSLSKALAARGPPKPTAWRSLAEQLVDEGCESVYLTRIRAQHDVNAHVDSIADEVAEEMAQALGRTTSKCDYAFAVLARDRAAHARAVDGVLAMRAPELKAALAARGLATGGNKPVLRARLLPAATEETRDAFEAQRKVCQRARSDLLIHRQALGFKTENHAVVEKYYPLSDLRPLPAPDAAPGDEEPPAPEPAPWAARKTYSKGRNWGGFRLF